MEGQQDPTEQLETSLSSENGSTQTSQSEGGNVEHSSEADIALENQESGNAEADAAESTKDEGPFEPKCEDVIALVKELDEIKEVGSKLERVIEFMAQCLATEGAANFRSFWESRRLSLQLFKEKLPVAVRALLWNRYRELSDEAKRLKAVLDEQATFAVEQIEMAIDGLEADLKAASDGDEGAAGFVFSIVPNMVSAASSEYEQLQAKVAHLNGFASRVNALRKELIKTDMRIRFKNKFFKRLSAVGDQIFPQRKELIKELSRRFIEDVQAFVESVGTDEQLADQLVAVREEIKAFQSMSKELGLNAKAFAVTRSSLSGLWDRLRDLDKERKKERQEYRQESRANADRLLAQIDEVANGFESGEITLSDASSRYAAIHGDMRKATLARPEVTELKQRLAEARKVVDAQEEKAASEAAQRRREKEASRQQAVEQLVARLREGVEGTLDEQALKDLSAEVETGLAKLDMRPAERLELDRMMLKLRDRLAAEVEKGLLQSGGSGQDLAQLQTVLEQRNRRLQECRDEIESLRRQAGASSLDFERAIQLREMIEDERERFNEIRQGVEEMEKLIAELK